MNPGIIDQIAEDAADLYRRLYEKLGLASGPEKREAVLRVVAHAMPAIVEANAKE